MSPKTRRGVYRPPRDRRELAIPILSSLAVVVVTSVLVWFVRPNQNSGSSTTTTSPTTSTSATSTTTAESTTTTTSTP